MRAEQTPFGMFLAGLSEGLRRLTFQKQLAFAGACCERAFPNYQKFSLESHWGDPNVLRAGIDVAWKMAVEESCEVAVIQALGMKCKTVTPSSDNFPGQDVTAAQEAAFMVTLLLEFCSSRGIDLPLRIATFARDTIDLYVQTLLQLDQSDPKFEQKITDHPLMRVELEMQRADLDRLRMLEGAEQIRVFGLKAVPQASNIGIPA